MTTAHLYGSGLESEAWPINDYLTIGSAQDCQLTLNAQGVADRHCRIEDRGDRWMLRSLHFSENTYLNGKPILEAPLNDGDSIRIGSTEWLFRTGRCHMRRDFPIRSRNMNFQNTLNRLAAVAGTDHTVLLLGSSGSGKEVLAQGLHQTSFRHQGPMVSVNCSAITETLIESELFGHLKGSFTGALHDRKGAFEAARGGTLFLDEIGDLPLPAQAKLLRALENREIRAVGSDKSTKTNVRVIAATHKNLWEAVAQKSFREDLFYRLNVIQFRIPALKDRPEDIEILAMEFARDLKVRFSFEAIELLRKHPWPGNVRELKNLVFRASAFFGSDKVSAEQLGQLLDPMPNLIISSSSSARRSILPLIQESEKELIIKCLRQHQGNQRRAAAELGMPKSTLNDRLKKYGIRAMEYTEEWLAGAAEIEEGIRKYHYTPRAEPAELSWN